MRILGLEHIGIAVSDLDECIGRFENLLGLKCKARKRAEANKVEVAVFDCGGTEIELVMPTDAESPVHGFIAKGGSSLHHICFKVEGLQDWLDFLSAQGVGLIDKVPRRGAFGDAIAFVRPKSFCNFLIELSEEE
jgi:methylmalonyl-CoA epimerase